jgi:thiamine biosynthesis lipoprotein
MGVQAQVTLYAREEIEAQRGIEAAFAEIDRIEALLSDYQPASELSRISAAAGSGEWTAISAEMLAWLRLSQDLSEKTGGGFDITVGPAVDLWRESRRSGKLPDSATRQDVLTRVGSHVLELREPSAGFAPAARLTSVGSRLDPGGFGKGLAAQRALHVLREMGHQRAMIALAGDIALGSPPPGDEGWRIAATPGGAAEIRLGLHDVSVSTSGDSEQVVLIGGTRYSHLVDPRTALGCTHRWAATVISRHRGEAGVTGATVDAVATALAVLGPEGGVSLARALTAQRTIDAAILWVPGLAAPIVIDPRGVVR